MPPVRRVLSCVLLLALLGLGAWWSIREGMPVVGGLCVLAGFVLTFLTIRPLGVTAALEARMRSGDLAGSMAAGEKLLWDHPGDPAIKVFLVRAYLQAGMREQATAMIESLEEDKPGPMWSGVVSQLRSEAERSGSPPSTEGES